MTVLRLEAETIMHSRFVGVVCACNASDSEEPEARRAFIRGFRISDTLLLYLITAACARGKEAGHERAHGALATCTNDLAGSHRRPKARPCQRKDMSTLEKEPLHPKDNPILQAGFQDHALLKDKDSNRFLDLCEQIQEVITNRPAPNTFTFCTLANHDRMWHISLSW